MKVLVVAEAWPWPPQQGDRVRLAAILEVLRRRGHEVTIAGAPLEEPAPEGFRGMALPVKRRYQNLVGASQLPITVALRRDRHISETVARWAHDVDRVLFYQLKSTAWLDQVEPNKVVLDLTDSLALYYRRRARVSRWWALEAWRAHRWEVALAQAFPTVVCSVHDRDAIGASVVIASNGYWPIPDYTPDPRPGLVVAVGNWAYAPNREGLQRFLDTVWPLVLKARPEAQLRLVGANPPDVSRYPQVVAKGRVADLAEVYRSAAVAVAAVDTGAGMKTKVLEALFYRVPVVATPLAGEGIAPTPSLTVATDAIQFADAVATQLGAPQPIDDEQLAAITRRYRWDVALAPLCALVEGRS